jgi:Ca2+-binding EF-hand superfamily protein
VFYYLDTNKDGKISKKEMLQSSISKQYQAGTLGKLPVIVEEPPK